MRRVQRRRLGTPRSASAMRTPPRRALRWVADAPSHPSKRPQRTHRLNRAPVLAEPTLVLSYCSRSHRPLRSSSSKTCLCAQNRQVAGIRVLSCYFRAHKVNARLRRKKNFRPIDLVWPSARLSLCPREVHTLH